jgi:hypothetical protein
LPDIDNTIRAFRYWRGLVEIEQLDAATTALAEALRQLVGLDKDPGNPDPARRPSAADRRWHTRQETWDLAEVSRHDLSQNDTPQLRSQIVRTAVARGGFGIWFTVFLEDQDMRQRLIAAFPGSTTDCFDAAGLPVLRPGGRL